MVNNNLPIALFDSGVGGLTVFKALRQELPGESLLYLGDTARVPYGAKSHGTIIRYTLQAAEKLMERGAKMLVIACNTATSAALPVLQKKYAPLPVLGVVEPGAQAAVKASRNGRIAVIATEATIRCQAYQNAIKQILPEARIISRACSLLVSLAEEGWVKGPVAKAVAEEYLKPIFGSQGRSSSLPDTLLLGCTHFPALLDVLAEAAGTGVKIVDSAQATAKKARQMIASLGMANCARAESHFLTTDNPERFLAASAFFLGEPMAKTDLELIDI